MAKINFKKIGLASRCDATRCKSEPLNVVEIDGISRKLCDKHNAKFLEAEAAPPAAGVDAESIQAQIAPVLDEARSTLAQLPRVVIQNQAMLDIAGQILQKTKGDAKRLDEQRKTATKPILDAKKTIDSWFKPAIDTLKEIEAGLKKAISTYVDAAQAAKVQALESGDHEAALAVATPELPTGVSTRVTWKFQIKNPELVPSDFRVIDLAKIQAVVNLNKDKTEIPGVHVYAETGVASSSS